MSDGIVRRKRKGRDVFLAQVRVGAVYKSKTFDDYQKAVDWHDARKAEIKGDREALEPPKETKATAFGVACQWGLDMLVARKKTENALPNDKNHISNLRWWLRQEAVTDISLATLNCFHLEAVIVGALGEGDGAAQTQIHRANTVSWLYAQWKRGHGVLPLQLPDPTSGIRPPSPEGRSRRCKDAIAAMGEGEDDEEAIVLAAAIKSTRRWLAPAIVIAIDSCIRQAELVGLRWVNVVLDVPRPHLRLEKTTTKTKKARTVPLTERAVAAFRELKAQDEQAALEQRFRIPDRPIPIETTHAIIQAWADLVQDVRREAIENGVSQEEAERLLDDLYWHDFRHEGISRFFERTNLSDLEIKEIAGHASLITTATYTHLRGANIDLKARSRLMQVIEDDPGTVKLVTDGALVMTVNRKWVPLMEADPLTRAHAEVAIRAAAAVLGRT